MRFFSILDRHIGRNVFYSTLLVLLVLFLLLSFILFAGKLGDLGKGNFSLWDLIKFVLLSQPKRLYEVFPMAALLGSIIGLSLLAASSEIVAMRAAGVSLLRIIGSVMKVGMVFVVAGMLIGEFIVPVTEDMAQRGRAEAMQRSFHTKGTGLWLRNGNEFINIAEVLPDNSLLNVSIYQFDSAMQLRKQMHAQSARYAKQGWQLQQLRESELSVDAITTRTLQQSDWDTPLLPQDLALFAVRPDSLSLVRLFYYIQHLEKNKQDTERYRLAFWNKVLTPFSTAVMIMLAIPFVFGQQRGGGVGQKIFLGIMLGLAFNMINLSFGYVAILYGLPAILGALLPPLLFLALTLYLIRRVA